MCDSAQQPAHRLHFSSHAQLPLQHALVGYVFHEHLEISWPPVIMIYASVPS
jgi:hypothetical protein